MELAMAAEFSFPRVVITRSAALFATLGGGALAGLALGTFATGSTRAQMGGGQGSYSFIPQAVASEPTDRNGLVTIDQPDRSSVLARNEEDVAPPVRVARYGGRLVVCTDCPQPVWQPQAAVPVTPASYVATSERRDMPDAVDNGVSVYVGTHDGV